MLTGLCKLGIVAITIGLLVGGCSKSEVTGPGEGGDVGYNLVPNVALEESEPMEYTVGDTITFNLVVTSRYVGQGRVVVEGHGGGNAVGEVLSPIKAPFGSVEFVTPIPKGVMTIPIKVLVTSTLSFPAMFFSVTLDSLQVNDRLVYWESAEGFGVFFDDAPSGAMFFSNYSAVTIVLDRKE